MQVAALAQGDETVDDASEVLRLGQRGLFLLGLHQGSLLVCEHRLAVADRAVEPAAVKPVTHRPCPFIPGLARETDCVAARQASPLLRRGLHARGEPIAPLPGQMPCARGEAQYGSSRRLASSSMFSGGQLGISMPRWRPMVESTSLISFKIGRAHV